ncbi:alpha/beta hydrolase [bacterium]|nr:MAG: alpha/beta hydrolase [bacterium]
MDAGTQRLTVDGRELELLWIPGAREDAPALVFLHEGLGSVQLWKDLPQQLVEATGAGALVYSRYGNGFSAVLQEPRDPRYMHHEALVVLPELLERVGLREPVLIGHSDGASIAVVHGAEHPVSGLALEAPHVFAEELSLRSIAAIREPYANGGLRERMARYHTDVDKTFYGWNDVWLSPAFRDWNIERYAARIIAPMLLVQGASDEYGTRAQLEAIRRASLGAVDELLLSNCGHAPHRDRPELALPALAAFVRACLSRRSLSAAGR